MMIYEFIKDIDYLRIYLVVLIAILVIRGDERHIYCFHSYHSFYKTDHFVNAKKPDANHPCRGDER